MRFENELSFPLPVERVWPVFEDVPQLSACIPGVTNVVPLEEAKLYNATVRDQIGPFRVNFEVVIDLVELIPARHIKATIQGKDAKLNSSLWQTLEVTLEPDGDKGTRVTMETEVNVSGKFMTLGYPIFKRKAETIMDRFAANLEALVSELIDTE